MGGEEYTDDASIGDEAFLWRRVPPWHFVFDENLGRRRPSSAAFENHPNGTPMSILIASLVVESGRQPVSVLSGHDGFALAQFKAGLARSQRQGVAKEPLPDEPAHGVVFGAKTNSVKKALSRGADWVIPPSDE